MAFVLRESQGDSGPIFNKARSVLHDAKTCKINPGAVI